MSRSVLGKGTDIRRHEKGEKVIGAAVQFGALAVGLKERAISIPLVTDTGETERIFVTEGLVKKMTALISSK